MSVAKDLSDFRWQMVRTGLWFYALEPDRKLIKFFQAARMWHFVILVGLWLVSGQIISWRLFMGRVYSGIVIGSTYIAAQWVVVSFTGRSLEEFVLIMKELLEKNNTPEDNEIFQTVMTPAWKFVRLFSIYAMSIVGLAFGLPILYDTIVTLIGVGKPLDMVVPVEGLLPGQKNFLYWFLIWGHIIGDLFGTFFLVGNVSLALLSVKYTIVVIRILCRKIDIWAETSHESSEALLLNDIISHHATVIKLTTLLNEFLAFQSILQNVAATLTVALFINASRMQEGSQMAFCLNNTFGLGCVVYMYCDLGEKLRAEGLLLYERLCSAPWHFKRVGVRRDLLMILRQAQRPLQISYKGWSIGMTSFTQVMNTTYSYSMLLSSVE